MNLSINKTLKRALIIINVILICILCILLFKEVNNRTSKEEKVAVYSYNNKASINYRVFLKPNIVYNNESMGENNIYIAEFVDYIQANFNYEFKGERTADIKGEYEIRAVVEGYAAEGQVNKTIWKKEFILVPTTGFVANDKTISVKKDISIKLQEYNEFANKVIAYSKISSQVKLCIFININLKSNTDKGLISEKISPSITIPLNMSYFQIKINALDKKPNAIEGTKKVEVPINKNIVNLYRVILLVLITCLLFLCFFISGVTIVDPLIKKLNSIFKNHGDRLVALNNEISAAYENYNEVKSIDDLVKVSDEIGKPIMYKYSSDFKDITEFYVFDNTQMYVLHLKNGIAELDYKKSDKEDKIKGIKNIFK